MTSQATCSQQIEITDAFAQLEGELKRAQRAVLRGANVRKAQSDEEIELLDAIEQELRIARARRLRHLPARREETEAPLALLRHLTTSAQHFQNLS